MNCFGRKRKLACFCLQGYYFQVRQRNIDWKYKERHIRVQHEGWLPCEQDSCLVRCVNGILATVLIFIIFQL